MKKTAVICASSPTYAFALYVSLRTFFKNSPKLAQEADVYVYAWNWGDDLKRLMASCGPVTVVDYDLPADIERTPFVMKFTPALFARFEGFNLLEKYQNVVCLDSDILVQKELVGVLEEMTENIGITRDSCPTVGHNFTAAPEGNYDLSRPCYNAGFLVLKRNRLPVPGKEVAHWLYDMLKKCVNITYLGDQGIINLALQKFQLVPYVFSALYNLPASSSLRKLKKAYIIHSTGHRKFWCYYFFKDWYCAYAVWRANGGSPALRKNTRLWDKLLAKLGLQNRVFFELAPDGFKYPGKFILFTLKRWFYAILDK